MLTYGDPCTDSSLAVITDPGQSGNTFSDTYTNTTNTFTYNPMTVPADYNYCTLTVSCANVTSGDPANSSVFSCTGYELDASTNTTDWFVGETEYNSANYPPDTYTWTYTVATDDALTNVQTFTVALTLTDPCPTATLATQPVVPNVPYFLTQGDYTIDFASDGGAAFSINPSLCNFTLSVDTDDDDLDGVYSVDSSAQTVTISNFTDSSLAIVGGAASASADYTVTISVDIASAYGAGGVGT